MKLLEMREAYEYASGKLSDITRQLAMAGFAIIWIFNGSVNDFVLPAELILPCILLCAALLTDVFQYISSTAIWHYVYVKNRKLLKNNLDNAEKDDCDLDGKEPKYVNKPIWFFFWTKITLLIIAYMLIGIFFITKL